MRFFFTPFIILFFLFGLTGCGCKQTPVTDYHQPNLNATLWQLQIIRQQSTLFTGLLALRNQQNGLSVILLDSTGITLLQGVITCDGEMEVEKTLIPPRYDSLPWILAKALTAISFTEATESCDRFYLTSITFEKKDNVATTTKKIGPFTQWQTQLIYDKKGVRQPDLIQWRNSLPAVIVSLQRIRKERGDG